MLFRSEDRKGAVIEDPDKTIKDPGKVIDILGIVGLDVAVMADPEFESFGIGIERKGSKKKTWWGRRKMKP